MDTKICIKCGIEKDVDAFYDAKGKNIKTPKKVNTCKECFNRITRGNVKAHYGEKQEKHKVYLEDHPDEKKECRICKKMLPIKNFSFHATMSDLMSGECRQCRTDYAKENALRRKGKLSVTDFPATKVCKICGLEKTIGDFNIHCGNKDLHRHECRNCQKENQQKHYPLVKDKLNETKRGNRVKDRPKNHNLHLKKKFGISLNDYHEMLNKQSGRCAICGTDNPSGSGKKIVHFAVDHDHNTGKNRSLLCINCNQGIGHFFDSPTLLRQAAEYLESFG